MKKEGGQNSDNTTKLCKFKNCSTVTIIRAASCFQNEIARRVSSTEIDVSCANRPRSPPTSFITIPLVGLSKDFGARKICTCHQAPKVFLLVHVGELVCFLSKFAGFNVRLKLVTSMQWANKSESWPVLMALEWYYELFWLTGPSV